jgi:hypothetical protein
VLQIQSHTRKSTVFNSNASVAVTTEIPAKKDDPAAKATATTAADATAPESSTKGVGFSSPITSSPPARSANSPAKTGAAAPARQSSSPIAAAAPPYDWTASVRNTIDAKLGSHSSPVAVFIFTHIDPSFNRNTACATATTPHNNFSITRRFLP